MARVSSLRDGERWEQVGVTIATKGATGAAVGLGLAVLLFGKLRTRAACMSVCTGAGVGHGLTLAKSNFEDARAYLPTQLSQATSTEDVWDCGVVNGIKKTGVGLLGGGLLALLVPSPLRMACLTGGAGVGLGMGCSETLLALTLGVPPSVALEPAAAAQSPDMEQQRDIEEKPKELAARGESAAESSAA